MPSPKVPSRPAILAGLPQAIDPFLSKRQVAECLGGIGTSTLDRRVRDGTFPPPMRIGTKRVAWRASVISKVLDEIAAGAVPSGERPYYAGVIQPAKGA